MINDTDEILAHSRTFLYSNGRSSTSGVFRIVPKTRVSPSVRVQVSSASRRRNEKMTDHF